MKKYADAFQRWNSWAKNKGLQALPAPGHKQTLYLAFLIKGAKSMATSYAAEYGIAWAHQKCSWLPQLTTQSSNRWRLQRELLGLNLKTQSSHWSLTHKEHHWNIWKWQPQQLTDYRVSWYWASVVSYAGMVYWDSVGKIWNSREYMRVFLEKKEKWPIPRRFLDFNCKDIKPYLSSWTTGKVPTKRGAQPKQFPLRKDFAHFKWHEAQTQELFSKQLKENELDPSLYGLYSLQSGGTTKGFIKIWSRRASGFDRQAFICLWALPSGGVWGVLPRKFLKFYSCILKHKLLTSIFFSRSVTLLRVLFLLRYYEHFSVNSIFSADLLRYHHFQFVFIMRYSYNRRMSNLDRKAITLLRVIRAKRDKTRFYNVQHMKCLLNKNND